MPRILLLMTSRTYRAEPFLRAAARLELDVTVGTERQHVLGHLAPEASLALDFRDSRAACREIVAFAGCHPLVAVVGVDDDTTVLAAQAATALGLPHNSVDSVKAARYKDVMREILAEHDVLSPPHRVVSLGADTAAVDLPFPLVVKPLSLSASRGVIRADDPRQLAAAHREVASILRESGLPPEDPAAVQVLVEEFIPGPEFAVEGLLVDGELTVLALFDKPDPLDGPYFEETIYVTPSRLPGEQQAALVASAQRACAALGLREGPIHAELRLNERGAWVIEVAARSIGGECSRSLRFDHDMTLEELILRQAARLELPSTRREGVASGVMMIPIPAAGTLRGIHGLDEARSVPGVSEVAVSIPLGHQIVPLPRGNRYLGFIFARGSTPQDVEASLRESHRRIRFDIGPPLSVEGADPLRV